VLKKTPGVEPGAFVLGGAIAFLDAVKKNKDNASSQSYPRIEDA
jgi:hypothetical protein